MAEKYFVRQVEPGLWQWRLVSGQGQWAGDAYYTGDINLLAESVASKTCWLVFDGRKVATRLVDVGVKDRKLLPKLVPFQVEEDIVTPVDNLIFAYGELKDGIVETAYAVEDDVADQIQALEDIGAEVESVVVDFIELDSGDGWVIVWDNDRLLVKTGAREGFSCDSDNAEMFIAALFHPLLANAKATWPSSVYLVADDEESLTKLRNWLPEAIDKHEELSIYEQEGSFWDVLSIAAKPRVDFRSGQLARKLPFNAWWQTWKVPAIAASVAFVVAAGVTWGELKQASVLSKVYFAERDAIYRQVVSGGSITDPVRQLRAQVGTTESTEPSNVVSLVSKVTPKVQASKDLKVTSFRYTQNNGTLQLNVEAKDFAMLEQLTVQLGELGLKAEIKNSKASGDVQQAQLRVSES